MISFGKAKGGFTGVVCNAARVLENVQVEGSFHEVKVTKEERFLKIEANGEVVPSIPICKCTKLIPRVDLFAEKVFFVVSHHDYERHIEDVL